MFKHRNSNFICCFLAALMLLFGMCLDITSTDSFLTYGADSSSEVTITSPEATFSSSVACTQQMLGQDERTTSLSEAKRSNTSTSNRLSLSLHSVAFNVQSHQPHLSTASIEVSNELPCNAVVINYIHQKDGKKA